MPSTREYKREREQLQMFLEEMGDVVGQQNGLVQRKSKLTGSKLVQVLVLGCLEKGKSSLTDFCQVASDLGVEISESGLHQRLGWEAVAVMSQLCQAFVSQKREGALKAVLEGFSKVHVIDSSEIHLHPTLASVFRGTRRDASMKVQLAYEYRSGQMEAIEVTAGCEPDHCCQLPQALGGEGELMVFDLGYFDQERFAQLDKAGVYFLSRLRTQVGVYLQAEDTQKVDLLTYLPAHATCGEMSVYLGRSAKVPVRLFYYRLPPDIVQERRRKLQHTAKKNGKPCSQRSLDWLEWSFFISNAPAGLLSVEQVAVLYRVRWQIELIFKLWKGEMDLDAMGKWRVTRILTQFYGRLLALLLFHRLVEGYHAQDEWQLSMKPAFHVLKRTVSRLIQIVKHHFRGFLTFLRDFDANLRRFATQTIRRKQPSTLDRLKAVFP